MLGSEFRENGKAVDLVAGLCLSGDLKLKQQHDNKQLSVLVFRMDDESSLTCPDLNEKVGVEDTVAGEA